MNADDLKKQAAARALELVRPGMRLGLGTGSTAKHFVDLLGVKVAAGFEVLCVSTSEATLSIFSPSRTSSPVAVLMMTGFNSTWSPPLNQFSTL